MPKLAIGFITYGESTAKYLPYFLPSLVKAAERSEADYKILAIDNTEEEDNENARYIKNNFSDVDFERAGKNLGFARAYNKMINKAVRTGAEYFLTINPDTIINEDAIEKMVAAMDDARLGSVSPKIYCWDFERGNKINIIDTVGLIKSAGLQFKDLGQGENDVGQHDKAKIFGPSGAAAFYRVSALEKIKDKFGFFDERMFMYKEDCDLAYRLYLSGYKSRLAAKAIVYHNRTARAAGGGWVNAFKARKNKSKKIKEWSFLNQRIIYLKHWRSLTAKSKTVVIIREIATFAYVLLFEPFLLTQYWELFRFKKHVRHIFNFLQ
ncbi:glycosyltransferase family 2 protein [Candidatus Falkowbacteria bacterium]|nr:glycosyltransferase family 2 protein [Candidatus Falkowbacteria bacterium]